MSFDAPMILGDLSPAALRASESMKWTMYPEQINGHKTIPCFVAEMDFAPAANIRKALKHWAEHAPLGYRPPALVESFQHVIAEHYRNLGLVVGPEAIRPISDVMTAYDAVARIFTDPGTPITLMTPAYMNFVGHIFGDQRPVRNVAMLPPDALHQQSRIDWDGLEKALADGGLLVLVNPHNPIGKVYNQTELEHIAELAQQYGVRVFVDEIHEPLVFNGHHHIPFASLNAAAAECAITAWSCTKAFSIPGTKAASLIFTREDDLQRWDQFGQHFEMGTASSGYVATISALEEGAEWFRAALSQLEKNRERLTQLIAAHLPGATYTPPEATYLAWIDLRGTDNYEAVAAKVTETFSFADATARRCGVIATDGAATGADGEGHLRVNFATGPEVLDDIAARLGSVFTDKGADY